MPLVYDAIYDFILDLISFEGQGPLDATSIEFRKRGFTLRRLRSTYEELLSLIEAKESGRGNNDRLAWKLLSAYVSVDKEGVSLSMDLSVARERAVQNISVEDDISLDAAIRRAKVIEGRLIECIRKICEMCVYGEQFDFNCNFLFEYFCDKNMLMLLVELFAFDSSPQQNRFESVVCSSLVKSQILQSLSMMINNVQDPTSIYYLLSNNYLNHLIQSFHPLDRFTSSALDEIVPMYVSLLKSLALKLRDHPHLVEFLIVPSSDKNNTYSFPLFSAAISVAMSRYAKSDAFGHITALSIVVNLCQIPSDVVLHMIEDNTSSQQSLFDHLCRELLFWCNKAQLNIMNIAVDSSKTKTLEAELLDLQDKLQFIDDLLLCGIGQLNVRLCEHILRRIVHGYIIPQFCIVKGDTFFSLGKTMPIKSLSVAKMHVSALFLTQVFTVIKYKPLLKMVAVSILHKLSPDLSQCDADPNYSYLTSKLHDVARIDYRDKDSYEMKNFMDNPFRRKLLESISCGMDETLFVSVSILLCSVIQSNSLDAEFLSSMQIIPSKGDYSDGLDIEKSLSKIFLPSGININLQYFHSTNSIYYAGRLVVTYLSIVSYELWEDPDAFIFWWTKSSLVRSLVKSRSLYTCILKDTRDNNDIPSIILDLFQAEVYEQYSKSQSNQSKIFSQGLIKSKLLNPSCCYFKCSNTTDVVQTKIDRARYFIRMVLYFRSFCERIMTLRAQVEARLQKDETKIWNTLTTENINDSIELVGALGSILQVGQDINLSGRTCFLCYIQQPVYEEGDGNRCDNASTSTATTPQKYLILVIDPSVIFAVQPHDDTESSGKIVFVVPMSHILATVTDGIWLYIARRPLGEKSTILRGDGSFKGNNKSIISKLSLKIHTNVYILKGNMIEFGFDSPGSCLIARESIEVQRSALKVKIEEEIESILLECAEDILVDEDEPGEDLSYLEDVDKIEIDNICANNDYEIDRKICAENVDVNKVDDTNFGER